jgi:predicted permease
MRRARRWMTRFAGLFGRARRERELAAELEGHLALHIEDNLRAGMTAEEARRQALIKLGGLEQAKELYRERSGIPCLETFWQDLRYGARMLRKSPGFTAVAIVTLALGIGANTAIYSLVSAVLLHPLPFRDPGTLVWVWCTRVDREKAFASIPNFRDFRDRNTVFDGMAAFGFWNPNLTGIGRPERLQGMKISAGAFDLLGATAFKGRTLARADDDPGGEKVVVLSYGLWKRLGGSDSLVGETIRLNDESYRVVGVLPRNFVFPIAGSELVIPLRPEGDPRRFDRDDRFLRMLGRLKPGVTLGEAQAQMSAIAVQMRHDYPKTNAKDTGVKLVPLQEEVTGKFQRALLVLLGAVALVLLIVCANLASLLLSRATVRRKEMAVRAAMGAARTRLVRQLLTESLLLAGAGGGGGVVVAMWSIPVLLTLTPLELPRAGEVHLDGSVLTFALVVSLLAGILLGLMPALRVTKSVTSEELKSGGRSSGAGERNRLRELLVAGEVALSLVLLAGTGLLLQSFAKLQTVQPGFEPSHVLTVRLSLAPGTYPGTAALTVFYRKLRANLLRLPGVEAAGAVSGLPLSGSWATTDFLIEGHAPASPSDQPSAQYRFVTPGYLEAMQIPMLVGRDFNEADTAESRKVAVVSETLARRYFAQRNPVGAHIFVDNGKPNPPAIEIVGVVGDVKHLSLESSPTADIYIPLEQMPESWVVYYRNNMHWAVRCASNPMSLATNVRREIERLDPNIAASNFWTMTQVLSASVAPQRFNLVLLLTFALAALVLAALGVYGAMAYAVTQRTQEIGLRIALGARGWDVLRLVMGRGFLLALAGTGAGAIISLALTRVMASLLYDVSARDPLTFAGVAGLLMLVALTACYVPARRATRVDPMTALRQE